MSRGRRRGRIASSPRPEIASCPPTARDLDAAAAREATRCPSAEGSVTGTMLYISTPIYHTYATRGGAIWRVSPAFTHRKQVKGILGDVGDAGGVRSWSIEYLGERPDAPTRVEIESSWAAIEQL